MLFSSPVFLFGFLPITLLVYYLSPDKFKNYILLFFSFLFYAWGEVFYLGIMILSIISNYVVGIKIQKYSKGNKKKSYSFLLVGVFINLLLLISYKYINFITDNINIVLSFLNISDINIAPVHLPLGISFFTFQALSYIVDVYRKEVSAQKSVFDLALYISLFPQLIAGPIVRYHDIANQIITRSHTTNKFSKGVSRFIYGLAKKILIANTLGEIADTIFAFPENELTMSLAWIGIIAYSLQIYFDFSGYSDMAIGLGQMFGFRFLENFNYPYIASSVRDFWRRWHISLSTWFRDYVYIPLGGSRVPTYRVYVNLLLVFVVTGFWHGASWNFLVWGLFHGLFLAGEHAGMSKFLEKLWKPIQHFYLLLVVLIGWVFFRADNLPLALDYIGSMFDFNKLQTTEFQYAQIISVEAVYVFVAAILLSMPVFKLIEKYEQKFIKNKANKKLVFYSCINITALFFLFFLSVIKIASSTYNPFIYFRF